MKREYIIKLESVDISELVGKVIINIEKDEDENRILMTTKDGERYIMMHEQDCCESVIIDDINGDLSDLLNSPILVAEEVSNDDFEREFEESFNIQEGKYWTYNADGELKPESYTWTFYKLATINGYVDIRWFGESNGYYSESVNLYKFD